MELPALPKDQPRAYDAEVRRDVLIIMVRKEFDFGNLHHDWASRVVREFPGPYKQVVFELGCCGMVSSTFFSGLLRLHQHFVKPPALPIQLVNPDPRVVRNLAVMHLDKVFRIVSREEMNNQTILPLTDGGSAGIDATLAFRRGMRTIRPDGT